MLTAANVKAYPADAVKWGKIREAAAKYGFVMLENSGKAESFGVALGFEWKDDILRIEINKSGALSPQDVFLILDPIIKKA